MAATYLSFCVSDQHTYFVSFVFTSLRWTYNFFFFLFSLQHNHDFITSAKTVFVQHFLPNLLLLIPDNFHCPKLDQAMYIFLFPINKWQYMPINSFSPWRTQMEILRHATASCYWGHLYFLAFSDLIVRVRKRIKQMYGTRGKVIQIRIVRCLGLKK